MASFPTNLFYFCLSVSIIFQHVYGGPDTIRTEIFRDDFNQDNFVDPAKWNIADRHTASESELSYYRSNQVMTRNRYLILAATNDKYGGYNYTSARVDTNGKFTFQYGEVEWQAKIPGGPDFYCGLWLTKPSNITLPLEFEPPAVSFVDSNGRNSQRLFYSVSENQQVAYHMGTSDTGSPLTFHVYRLSWTAISMEWYIDENLVYSVNDATKIPQSPMQIVMNTVVGGVFSQAQPNDSSSFAPRQMLINSVVVRQSNSDRDTAAVANVNVAAGGGSGSGGAAARTDDNKTPAYFGPVVGLLVSLLVAGVIVLAVLVFMRFRTSDGFQSQRLF